MAEMLVIRLGELVSKPQALRMQQAERLRGSTAVSPTPLHAVTRRYTPLHDLRQLLLEPCQLGGLLIALRRPLPLRSLECL